MGLKVQLGNGLIHKLCAVCVRNALDTCEVVDVLFNGHVLEDWIRLRAIANQLLDLVEVLSNIESADLDGAACRLYLSSETLEGR